MLFHKRQAEVIYTQILDRLEADAFFKKVGIVRNLETTMQLFFLYLSLVMIVLKHQPAKSERSQIIFDYCFEALESSYLEHGASDYSIGHKMKKALKFFYGGLAAYEQAIFDGDAEILAKALRKNIYVKQKPPTPVQLQALVQTVGQTVFQLKKVNWSEIDQVYF